MLLRYVFGDCWLDPGRRELGRGAALVAIEPQVFDLLEHLLKNRDRVVKHQELIETIWGGRVVSESALSTRINAVRSAIGDSGSEQHFIKTFRRKGFRFVAEVTEERALSAPVTAEPVAHTVKGGDSRAAPFAIQRRQLSVLACELLTGAVTRGRQLDVEDLHGIVETFHGCASDTVARHNGTMVSIAGNTMLACFGFPSAHEDDADQAVRAGLQICSTMTDLGASDGAYRRVRAGICTGLVLVDATEFADRGHLEIVGEAPQTATRLSNVAQYGTVVVDSPTRRLIGDLFECHDLGSTRLPGDETPIPLWQVSAEHPERSRFEALHPGFLAPLIGRKEETAHLARYWDLAEGGKGQVVLISGEPGIGKSRLIHELRNSLADHPINRLSYFASAHHQDSTLYPFAAELEAAAGILAADSSDIRYGKLKLFLQQSRALGAETLKVLAELLDLSQAKAGRQLDLDSERRRRLVLQTLVERIIDLARSRPTLVTMEDAHWLDSSSRELIGMLVEQLPAQPLLLVVSRRLEFEPHWIHLPHARMMSLNRLDERDAAELVVSVAGETALPTGVVQRIVQRTDGVPLFVEELTKDVIEGASYRGYAAGSGIDSPLDKLPTSLQASLVARLDRLTYGKEVAQIGAVLGREFSYRVLAAVVSRPAEALQLALDQLVQAGLLFTRGAPPNATFIFKHALVQDAAYNTLLRSERQALHARTATVLEQRFPEIAAAEPERLAHHFTKGGLHASAIHYLVAAGERALRRSAVSDAIRHLNHGRELIEQLPAGADRDRKEMHLTLPLGQAIWTVKGYGEETLQLHERARDLIDDNTTLDERIAIIISLWRVKIHRSELAGARELIEQCISLIEAEGRDRSSGHVHVLSAHAHRLMGMTLFFMGRFQDARRELEHALTLYRSSPANITSLTLFGADHAQSMLGLTLLPLGFADQAESAVEDGVDRASAAGHVVAIGVARVNALTLKSELAICSQQDADETAAYCVENGIRMYVPWAQFLQGVLLAEQRHSQRGIEVMRDALATADVIHAKLYRPWQLARLALAHKGVGRPEEGLKVLDDAIVTGTTTGERFFEAELYRDKADLLIAIGETTNAEIMLRRAIDVARASRARTWELRATMSLAKLLRDTGRRSDGRHLVATIYAGFTEGFSSKDLREAKSLLDQMA